MELTSPSAQPPQTLTLLITRGANCNQVQKWKWIQSSWRFFISDKSLPVVFFVPKAGGCGREETGRPLPSCQTHPSALLPDPEKNAAVVPWFAHFHSIYRGCIGPHTSVSQCLDPGSRLGRSWKRPPPHSGSHPILRHDLQVHFQVHSSAGSFSLNAHCGLSFVQMGNLLFSPTQHPHLLLV